MESQYKIEENILNLLKQQLLTENDKTLVLFIKCLINKIKSVKSVKNITLKKITEDVEK